MRIKFENIRYLIPQRLSYANANMFSLTDTCCTELGRNTWRFGNTAVSGIVGLGNLSLSALLARLKAFQLPWSAGLWSIGLWLWICIVKTTVLSLWLSGYFVCTSILIGTTVSIVAILYCCGWENFRETASAVKWKNPGREPSHRTPENIERLRQTFVRSPPLSGMCWQQGTPPHRHYIQEVNIVIKLLWDKDNFSNKFT